MILNKKNTLIIFITLWNFNAYSATAINLNHQKTTIFSETQKMFWQNNAITFKEIKTVTDQQGARHIRVQEEYLGYPVAGGDFIIHLYDKNHKFAHINQLLLTLPQTQANMTGTLYQGMKDDLINTPHYVFTDAQAKRALKSSIAAFEEKINHKVQIENDKTQLIIYIDHQQKAHFAYQTMFDVTPMSGSVVSAKPAFIIDAMTLKIYEQWNEIKNLNQVTSFGGGFGGAVKEGKYVYDGLTNNLPKLDIVRDTEKQLCSMENDDIAIIEASDKKVANFPCAEPNRQHNNVFWNGAFHRSATCFSPDNDALFGGSVMQKVYREWYKSPIMKGKINIMMHAAIGDNTYWDGKQIVVGDNISFSITSAIAHEMSHIYTEENSNLHFYGQAGAINESFSDMATQVAEFYVSGKNSWKIGYFRYFDKPSRDCGDKKQPGDFCSIDDASQYRAGLDIHFGSGVYNRFFYLLAHAKDWDITKAFAVMVRANTSYWNSNETFESAMCGVISATKDYNYPVEAVLNAAREVKINTEAC